MTELAIPPHALRRMIEQLRTLSVADTPSEDAGHDMRRGELQAEIEALDRDQQHELVALLWLGRGDFTDDEWEDAVALARERHVGPCFDYVMSHPMAADELAAGLEEIGHDDVLSDVSR
ncbi:DUF3775 domain-containing protein [Jannaschia pohangensis]|uniref:DUF3775 domain-containing protein n=1 Tax=Jannaschia pohangensis TaxID=390807 RepID=A0A1I3GZN5_9RHOB|nr:DUF3775 domain-containing protein [Jannaschia pohangensis]SFI28777.1 Protein of unknown function [Jannaschia pohangensis]